MRKPPINKLIGFQSATLCVLCLCVWLISGETAFYSALLGVSLVIVPQTFFAKRVFSYRGAKYAKEIIHSFYISEAIKIVMTMVGFTVIFVLVHPLDNFFFLMLFIIGQLLSSFYPVIFKNWSASKTA